MFIYLAQKCDASILNITIFYLYGKKGFCMENIEERLCGKTILRILQGDVPVGYYTLENSSEKIQLQMPYLSGPDICDIANKFGISLKYGGSFSRWEYMRDLMSGCIKSGSISKLLGYLFSANYVAQNFRNVDRKIIADVCRETVNAVLESINAEWILGDVELIKTGNLYEVRGINNAFVPETSKIKHIDREYIHRLAKRAFNDIQNSDFDGAISKSRTLLEEIFCVMIERRGEASSNKGDIIKLYNQVKQLYGMHENKDVNERINELLSGINKIVDSISRMRNISGDAHGLGNKRIGISEHHAKLVLNSACCLADFMLSVCDNKTSTL